MVLKSVEMCDQVSCLESSVNKSTRILWVTHYIPNTALFNPKEIVKYFLTSPCQGSDLSSLGRLIMKKYGLMVGVAVANPSRGCSMNFEGLPNAPSTAHGARSAAATELRRSRCCDGDAQTSSVALILRIASRRDALNEEPASFPPGLIQISMVVAHSPRPPP